MLLLTFLLLEIVIPSCNIYLMVRILWICKKCTEGRISYETRLDMSQTHRFCSIVKPLNIRISRRKL